MHKFTLFLFLIAAVLAYALFSFYGTYSECYEVNTEVQSAYADLYEQSKELAGLSVKMGSFALKYLPNGRNIVTQMEKAKERVLCPESVSDLSASCGEVYLSMKKIILLLKYDMNAEKDYRFQDALLQFNKISRDLSLTGRKYNYAAKQYNQTLMKPMPRFWAPLFDTEPAQLFKEKKKK